MTKCPCGSGVKFEDCCQISISGQQWASTPEQLMRSRYTAYTLCDIDYISKTMQGAAKADFDLEATRAWANRIKWIKLTIVETSSDQDKGFVEFVAHYSDNHKIYSLSEKSEFHLIDGKWYYVDGTVPAKKSTPEKSTKVARNDPCPCGSHKKYKKCCGV